jgi:hypothetical protein
VLQGKIKHNIQYQITHSQISFKYKTDIHSEENTKVYTVIGNVQSTPIWSDKGKPAVLC